jgi:hypothetical protein
VSGPAPGAPGRSRDPAWWQLPLLIAVSVTVEWLYLHQGLNPLDEGWPLNAAMRLHAGGRLYEDVFFVFPPGHALPAWIATALDPPGVILARVLYAGFNVALCAALYALGRRIMAPAFALLAGLLLAVAAPDSHFWQLLFGYRFLVISAIALLCFARRIDADDRRFTLAAGFFAGVALLFRLTPSASVSIALAVTVLAVVPSWPGRLRDWALLAAGFSVAVLPALVWFAAGVGLDVVWREAIVRPLAMTDLQSRSVPQLAAPAVWDRIGLKSWFTAFQFRAWALLYGAYALALAWRWRRCARAGRPFDRPMLLAVVLWGGIYFTRAYGRADTAHLDSAIPPVCLLLAHAASLAHARMASHFALANVSRALAGGALIAVALASWIVLLGVDVRLASFRAGTVAIASVPGKTRVPATSRWIEFDERVAAIRRLTPDDAVVFDASAAPLLHVLSGRPGPGGPDLVIPGTFLDASEERAFIERLEGAPPALVVAPARPFDRDVDRAVQVTAPRLTRWVKDHYRAIGPGEHSLLLLPVTPPAGPAAP